MAGLFDTLQLELHRSEDGTRFEGTGTIPVPEDGWDSDQPGPLEPVLTGEVGEGTLRRLS